MKNLLLTLILVFPVVFGADSQNDEKSSSELIYSEKVHIVDWCHDEGERISNSSSHEVNYDRAAGDVAIVPNYNDKPSASGTIFLKRGSDGIADWSPPITVQTHPDGFIRLWTRSMETFSSELYGVGRLDTSSKYKIQNWQGWTPEHSRCANRSNRIRVRLGPNRCMLIECL